MTFAKIHHTWKQTANHCLCKQCAFLLHCSLTASEGALQTQWLETTSRNGKTCPSFLCLQWHTVQNTSLNTSELRTEFLAYYVRCQGAHIDNLEPRYHRHNLEITFKGWSWCLCFEYLLCFSLAQKLSMSKFLKIEGWSVSQKFLISVTAIITKK